MRKFEEIERHIINNYCLLGVNVFYVFFTNLKKGLKKIKVFKKNA